METVESYRANTASFLVTITKNGSAEDITGGTIVYALKDSDDTPDNEAKIFETITSFTDAPNGKHKISLSRSDLDISPKTYSEEILYKSAAGIVKTVLRRYRRIKKVAIDIDV